MPRLCRGGIKGPAADTCCGDGTTVGVDGAKLAYLSRACQRLQVLAGDRLPACLLCSRVWPARQSRPPCPVTVSIYGARQRSR